MGSENRALLEQLSNEVSKMVGHVAEIRNSHVRIEKQLAINTAQLNLQGERLKKLESRFDDLEKRFDGMESRFDDLEKRFDGMESRFDDLEKRFDRLDYRVETLAAKSDHLAQDERPQ